MKLILTIELDYDAELWHGGDDDPEAKRWFFSVLSGGDLVLHENTEIGDDFGTVRVLAIDTTAPRKPGREPPLLDNELK